jgi:hypothetical protein
MSDLIKYNAAKRALAEAVRIDDVKDIRDKAVAMRMYAMQAKDRGLIDQATEIRLRAERRAGELLRDMEKNKGTRGDGRPKIGGRGERPPKDQAPKLSDLDINKSQSSKWQKLAEMPEGDFEQLVAHAKHMACTAVLRAQQSNPKPKPKPKSKPKRNGADIAATCVSEVEMIVRAATRGMDMEERQALLEQLITAVQGIMVGATVKDTKADRNADHDRWVETTH